MTKLGMNAEAVEALAQKLDMQAGQLQTAIGQIESLVNRAVNEWHGNDAQAFGNWWHSQHKPAMQRAHDAIAGLAQSAKNNVAEQRGVSNTQGASGQGPVLHGAPVPHPTHGISSGPGAPNGDHGPAGHQGYSAGKSIDAARSEVGTRHEAVSPTGNRMDEPGQCVKSVQRWIGAAGGHFGGGGVVSSYTNSGAVEVQMPQVHAGDVLQFTSTTDPESWGGRVHTVLVAGVNPDGTYDIIQSNVPADSGLVSEVKSWTPYSADGWQWRAWRFAAQQ